MNRTAAATRSRACDQARSLVSLRLDDELSELEQALLDAHVTACAACASFSIDVLAATAQLRAAPFERLAHPVALPAPARRYLRTLQTAAAGAVAAAAVVAGVVGVTPQVLDSSSAEPSATRFTEPVSPRWELQLRRQAEPRQGPGGVDTPV